MEEATLVRKMKDHLSWRDKSLKMQEEGSADGINGINHTAKVFRGLRNYRPGHRPQEGEEQASTCLATSKYYYTYL